MWKWVGVALAVGMLLLFIEWNIARKKKGGVNPTDKQRLKGMFWVIVGITIGVGVMAWLAE